MLLVTAALAWAMVLSGQAPKDEVVLLPGADGHVGRLVVERDGQRHVLDRPYAASRAGATEVEQRDPAAVRASFGPVLAALPGRPASFLLYFEFGKDELTPASRAELERILDELRRRPVPDIAVIAHTDTVGDVADNDRLSAQRAERVKQYLIGIGIAASRIHTAGRGERELLVPTADNVDEPRNRRVEINVR
ncbi:MAG TPA: OmpA family protein [Burkholderiales bacterium]|nr:OmpA family protein [Burkholderiales bacterium]